MGVNEQAKSYGGQTGSVNLAASPDPPVWWFGHPPVAGVIGHNVSHCVPHWDLPLETENFLYKTVPLQGDARRQWLSDEGI